MSLAAIGEGKTFQEEAASGKGLKEGMWPPCSRDTKKPALEQE